MFKTLALASFLTVMSMGAAVATPMDTITVSGTFNSGTKDYPGLFLAPGADLGNAHVGYTATYSFDPSTMTASSCSGVGSVDCTYIFSASHPLVETLTASSKSYTFTATNGSITLCSSGNPCGSVRFQISGVTTGGINISDFHLYASEQLYTGTNLSSDPMFLNLDPAGGSLQDMNVVDNNVAGGITISGFNKVAVSYSNITAIPEPLTVSLFGAGLAGAAALRRRKSKRIAA